MATRTWTVDVDATPHTVEVQHGYWFGKRVIRLDGHTIHDSRKFWDTGSEHRFDLGGHPCILKIRNSPFHYDYELFVDGRLV
jgi:hypothetical protein